jgi:hypothetical protein
MSIQGTSWTRDELCWALARRYPGLKFLSVQVDGASDEALIAGDDLRVFFTVSGSAADLERHRFAEPSWWATVPPSGEGRMVATEGLGQAYRVWRNKKGYRIQSGEYVNGLDRVAAVMMPALLPWKTAAG